MNFKNWSDYHHQIYRIYHGVIALSLVPFFLVFLELEGTETKEARVSITWVYLILIVFIPGCFFLMWTVWQGKWFDYEDLKEGHLKEKLIEFRRVEVKKYLALALVCVLGLVGLWLTAHYLFVLIYFAVLAQLSFLRPSEDRLVRSMKLTKEDRKKLRSESI